MSFKDKFEIFWKDVRVVSLKMTLATAGIGLLPMIITVVIKSLFDQPWDTKSLLIDGDVLISGTSMIAGNLAAIMLSSEVDENEKRKPLFKRDGMIIAIAMTALSVITYTAIKLTSANMLSNQMKINTSMIQWISGGTYVFATAYFYYCYYHAEKLNGFNPEDAQRDAVDDLNSRINEQLKKKA